MDRHRNAYAADELVSVIIPSFNVESTLDQCLASIRSQKHARLQIICLNDGSTDGTLQIIEKHAAEDNRVVAVDKPNEGYGATCNRGLDLAEGEWIAIVEPDDWIDAVMYSDMLSFASSLDAPCDIVKTPYWRVIMPDTPDQRELNCHYRHRVKPQSQPFPIRQARQLLRQHPSIWSALYRTEYLKGRGIRFREIPGAGWADNPFLVETLCQTDRIAYLDSPYYHYRESSPDQEKRMIARDPLMPLARWSDMLDILDSLRIADDAVREEVYRRGFVYYRRVVNAVGAIPEVLEITAQQFRRLDSAIVLQSSIISPEEKRLFCNLAGIECPAIKQAYWLRRQAVEFIYMLRNTGIRHTAKMLGRALQS